MGNRIKDIWAGFEQTTSRHLTGAGVDNIIVPHRVDYAAEDEALLPETFDTPASAAFTALREKLAGQHKKFGRNAHRSDRSASETMPPDMANQTFNGDDLIKGMQATAMRTERPERDYQSYMASDEGRAALKRHKKKKRFGIF